MSGQRPHVVGDASRIGSDSHLANVLVIIEAHADAVGGVAAQFCAAGAIQNLNLNRCSSRTVQLALQKSVASEAAADRGLLPLDLATANVLHSEADICFAKTIQRPMFSYHHYSAAEQI